MVGASNVCQDKFLTLRGLTKEKVNICCRRQCLWVGQHKCLDSQAMLSCVLEAILGVLELVFVLLGFSLFPCVFLLELEYLFHISVR